jgi:DHA2 family multidrug resistance protein
MGMSIVAFGTFFMTRWELNISMEQMAWESLFQGMGMAFIFAPVSALVFEGLPHKEIASASGMFSFARNIGLSIGVATFSTILTNQTQVNWNRLGENLNPYNHNLINWLAAQHLTLSSPTTPQVLANLLSPQANMIAYLDVYLVSATAFVLMIPLVLFIKNGRVSGSGFGEGH